MRLIDADAMKERLGMGHECDECDDPRACRYDGFYAKRDFCLSIDDEPTVEERTGRWIEREVCDKPNIIEEWQSAKCSNCGKYHTTPYLYYFNNYKYCPNCGAKMDVDEVKEDE